MENLFKKYWWILVLIIILLLLAILWLLLVGKSNNQDKDTSTTTTSQATKSATQDSQKPEATESDEELLKKAVAAKTGIALDVILVTVSQNNGKHAKGLVSAQGEMGGGYWLAVKENGGWSIVFDGQNTPECSLVDPSGFPASMVPECFDAAGNIVTRN